MCYPQHSHPESKPSMCQLLGKERSPVPVESRTVGALRQLLGKPLIYPAQRTLRSVAVAALSCILSHDSHLPRARWKRGCFLSCWSLLSSAARRVFSCGTAAVSWEPCVGHRWHRDTSCCALCLWECFAGMAWAPGCISGLFLAVGIWWVLQKATVPRQQGDLSMRASPSGVLQISWRLWQGWRCSL